MQCCGPRQIKTSFFNLLSILYLDGDLKTLVSLLPLENYTESNVSSEH